MPKTASLLTLEERHSFSSWLERRRVAAGVSRSQIAQALGDDSNQRANRYLENGVIPMPVSLVIIAQKVGVPWPIALWRAGHLRELLRVFAVLGGLEGHHIRVALVHFALSAFSRYPRPLEFDLMLDTETQSLVDVLDEEAIDLSRDKGLPHPTRLPIMLKRAYALLIDSSLPARLRRELAAIYVDHWTSTIDEATTTQIRVDQLQRHASAIRIMQDAR